MIQHFWGGARDSAFLGSSQAMLVLLALDHTWNSKVLEYIIRLNFFTNTLRHTADIIQRKARTGLHLAAGSNFKSFKTKFYYLVGWSSGFSHLMPKLKRRQSLT